MARVEKLRERYEGLVEFAYIYIKEAHPDDEWQMDSNLEDGVVYEQPQSFDDRLDLARAFVSEMSVETLTLVDDIRNTANACFAAWPERFYVVHTDGRIAYKGGMGPFYFDPAELEEFLEKRYGAPPDTPS